MDLISRETVIVEMDKRHADCDYITKGFINSLPSAFEGMTYGEVIKAVLGIKDEQIEEAKYLICIYPKGNHHDPFMAVKREVWNSPYKELSVICGTVGASE